MTPAPARTDSTTSRLAGILPASASHRHRCLDARVRVIAQ